MITVYSTSWCGDCKRAKLVLDQHQADYEWIDIDEHPEAVEEVLRLNGGMRSVPTIVFPDGTVMVEPSNAALAAKLTAAAT